MTFIIFQYNDIYSPPKGGANKFYYIEKVIKFIMFYYISIYHLIIKNFAVQISIQKFFEFGSLELFSDMFKQKSCILKKIKSDVWLVQSETCFQKWRKFFFKMYLLQIFKVQQWFMALINRTERQQVVWKRYRKILRFSFRITKKHYFDSMVTSENLFGDSEAKSKKFLETLLNDLPTFCQVNLSHKSLL
jgi:hypothetical protein